MLLSVSTSLKKSDYKEANTNNNNIDDLTIAFLSDTSQNIFSSLPLHYLYVCLSSRLLRVQFIALELIENIKKIDTVKAAIPTGL